MHRTPTDVHRSIKETFSSLIIDMVFDPRVLSVVDEPTTFRYPVARRCGTTSGFDHHDVAVCEFGDALCSEYGCDARSDDADV
jgi:hypothetical protein